VTTYGITPIAADLLLAEDAGYDGYSRFQPKGETKAAMEVCKASIQNSERAASTIS